MQVTKFSAQGIANLAWAFAKVGQLDEKLFAALGKEAEQRAGEFKFEGIAQMKWAYKKLGVLIYYPWL